MAVTDPAVLIRKNFGYQSSADLCRQIAEKSRGVCLLAFSTGKDALSAWNELRKYFKEIHPVYYYTVPDLGFVEKSLTYYEKFFGTRIFRVPNPNFYRQVNNGMYQTPGTQAIIDTFGFNETAITRDWLCEQLKEDNDIYPNCYTAIGNRMYDNLQRYRSITKFGPVNHKKLTFYPTYDYKIENVLQSIRESGAKLPIDYRLWGKTFDGLDYRFIKAVQANFPDDYRKLKEFFPLLDVELIRYEKL